MTKADKAAADRLLRRALVVAAEKVRAGTDPRPDLEAAVRSADMLLEAS